MINIIRFFLKQKDFVVLFLVLTASISLILSNNNSSIINLKTNLNSTISTIFSPILWYKNIFSLKGENVILKEKIARLNIENKKLSFYNDENQRLKRMLEYKNSSEFNLKVAKVLNHNLSPNLNSFSLDIGLNENIKSNSPVMDMNGIIGKTYNIDNNKTIIQLITDKNFRISIRIGRNRNLGVFIPNYSKIGIIEGIPKSQEIMIGEIVLTSGISNIYPGNIPIAKVISTYIDPNELFQNITVKILADIFNPDYVFIIE